MYKRKHISLSESPATCISHYVALLLSSLWLYKIQLCTYLIFFTPVCVDGHLGWFHIEVDVDSAAINMEVQLPLWFLTLIPLEPILLRPLLDKNILERGALKQNLTE